MTYTKRVYEINIDTSLGNLFMRVIESLIEKYPEVFKERSC